MALPTGMWLHFYSPPLLCCSLAKLRNCVHFGRFYKGNLITPFCWREGSWSAAEKSLRCCLLIRLMTIKKVCKRVSPRSPPIFPIEGFFAKLVNAHIIRSRITSYFGYFAWLKGPLLLYFQKKLMNWCKYRVVQQVLLFTHLFESFKT